MCRGTSERWTTSPPTKASRWRHRRRSSRNCERPASGLPPPRPAPSRRRGGGGPGRSGRGGGPGRAIVETAKEIRAQVIVLGEHHHGLLGNLFGADVDAEVQREVGCDVILA